MARLGELLTSARLIESGQVERALRAQVMWGARLGTNLVELGAIDLETLTRALARQHAMPAAQEKLFERADVELQDRLPAELAAHWSIVPLLYIKKERKTAVAALGPLPDEAIIQISDALVCAPDDLLVAVAPELRIRYHLERVYKIARPPRFLRSRKSTITPFPQFDNIPIEIDSEAEVAVPIIVDETAHPTGRASTQPPISAERIADMIEEAVQEVSAREPTVPAGRERRTYVRTLGEQEAPTAPTDRRSAPQLGRIALRRVALSASQASLLEALRAIRRGSNRDRVADLAIEALDKHVPSCDTALILVVRGDVAIGWKSFTRTQATLPELAVPLDQPGLAPTAVEKNATVRCCAGELGRIDQRLLRLLGETDGDLVVVPIAIANRVVALIATVTEARAAVDSVEAVADAAAAAFARLIRNASR